LTNNSVSANNDDEEKRLTLLEDRVNDLDETHREWYKNPSVLISFFALLASILSLLYGFYRDRLKDKDERISQLQSSVASAVVQLHTFETQWMESYAKYKDNPEYQATIASAMKAEMNMTAVKAYSLLNNLGDDGSALDSAAIANALEQAGDYDTASKALLTGLKNAKNSTEYVTVARMIGQLEFYRHNTNDGNKYFGLAEQSFEKYPEAALNQAEVDYNNAVTELYWALAAASNNACNDAKNHVERVKQYVAGGSAGELAAQSLTSSIKVAQTFCPALEKSSD